MAKNFACSIHFLNFVDNHTSLCKIKHILIHYTIWYTQRILNCVEQLFLPWVASIMLLLWQQSTLLHSCIPWRRQTTVEWVPACGTNARNFLSTGNTCPVNFNKENHVNMSQKAICMTIISTNFPRALVFRITATACNTWKICDSLSTPLWQNLNLQFDSLSVSCQIDY